MTRAIAIIGTLDTKGEEVAYLRDLIVSRGHPVLVIDAGVLGQPTITADISREAVAKAGGGDLRQLIAAGDKGRAIQTMITGSRETLLRLYAEGRLAGAIALGGGQGTAIGTAAMQALPIGFPKLMVSTIASGANTFEPYVGTTDMTLMHSVADIAGINAITRRILSNAAAAITGMADAGDPPDTGHRAIIGATMLGLTTPCVLQARAHLEGWGYEVITFHPNGTGGRCLERLMAEGLIRGAFDVSLQEITGYVCHGLFDAGADRLMAAARLGLPQVIAPGGTDYIVLGALASLSQEQRNRPRVIHNPNITLVRTSKDEMERIGQIIASRLNAARGRVCVLIPTEGFSASNRPGQAFYDPQADQALVDALENNLDSRVELIKVSAHINDPAFSEIAARKMHALMEQAGHPPTSFSVEGHP